MGKVEDVLFLASLGGQQLVENSPILKEFCKTSLSRSIAFNIIQPKEGS